MDIPPELRDAAGREETITITTRAYDGEAVIAVDFASVSSTPTLDVVGERAILVVDVRQLEFDVPPEADEVTLNGTVLTIRGETATD